MGFWGIGGTPLTLTPHPPPHDFAHCIPLGRSQLRGRSSNFGLDFWPGGGVTVTVCDAAKINEYKARMLASPKSKLVLDTIFDAALDNDHKNQSAAWKLVMDRILPVAAFEKDIVQNGGKSAIQINITGVGTADVKEIDPNSIQPSSESDGFNLKPTIIDGDNDEIL